MATVEALRTYVGASISDDAFLSDCLNTGTALVDAYVLDSTVPQQVLETCYLQVASELYHRRSAPSGIAQFAVLDGQPVREARDPLSSVYAILNRYTTGGV